MKKFKKITSVIKKGLLLMIVFMGLSVATYAVNCEITKINGMGFSTTIASVTDNGNGTYTIVLRVDHNGCGGPSCKELSHYSIEADPGTYSNVSVNVTSGGMTYGQIDMGPNLGSDPFDGFKIDGTGGIGGGDAGTFEVTYTLTSLQSQQTSAKAGPSGNIVGFTQAEFQQVLNCQTPTNNPPVAVDDSYSTSVNVPVSGDVSTNDSDPDNDDLTVNTTPVSGPSNGSVTLNSDGTFTYTPDNAYTGTDTFVYEICDDGTPSECDQATVTITIVGGPTAVDDSETTPINTPVDIDALDNDIAGSGALDPTSVSFVGGTEPPSSEGVFTVNATTGLVTFTPANGYTGTSTIDYEVCDVNSLCDIATITVTITGGGSPDTDGDGCTDDVDDYPNDPDRCFDNYYPATGNGTLAYEDLWPGKGDYDFNDLIIDYRFKTVTDAGNDVVEIFATFTVKAFGAGFQNGFGFQFPDDNVDQDDITVTGYNLQEGVITLTANGLEDNQTKPTIILYDNAYNILQYPGSGIGVNTSPGSPYVDPVTLNLYIDLVDDTYSLSDVDIANFNPFIFADQTRGREVHLPNYPPTDLVDASYFGTEHDDSNPNTGRYYKTENNLPWAINIYESFDYPKEKVEIISAYNFFQQWAESNGSSYQDWYQDQSGYRNESNIYQVP